MFEERHVGWLGQDFGPTLTQEKLAELQAKACDLARSQAPRAHLSSNGGETWENAYSWLN
jgi:hypothetical protein